MRGRSRGRFRRPALAFLIAGGSLFGVGCESAAAAAASARNLARPTPADTAIGPAAISLHAWAPAVGARVTWLEPDKKLRFQTSRHEAIFELGRREITFDGLRIFLGTAPQYASGTLTISSVDRDTLLLPLFAPEKFGSRHPVRTIVLDAGHGGRDNGTRNQALKLLEKNLALDLVQRLQLQLESRGYRVVLTREDDTYVDLADRPKRAALANADLFLSIHFNAGPPSVSGIETYTLTPQYQYSTASDEPRPEDDTAVPGNAWDPWNTLLGFSIHRQLRQDLGRFDRGLKRARFVVIRDLATCPGVLVECGYLSNREDAQLAALPAHREQIAAAIAAGVDTYAALMSPAVADAAPAPATRDFSGGAIRAPRTDE